MQDIGTKSSITCMCSCVPLQIECIIETLSTEGAEVSLCIAVTLHVTIQQPGQTKGFSTGATGKPRRVIFTSHWWQLFTLLLLRHVSYHWVLDPVTAVDQLQVGVLGDAVALLEDEDALLQVVDAEEVFLFVSVPRRRLLSARRSWRRPLHRLVVVIDNRGHGGGEAECLGVDLRLSSKVGKNLLLDVGEPLLLSVGSRLPDSDASLRSKRLEGKMVLVELLCRPPTLQLLGLAHVA